MIVDLFAGPGGWDMGARGDDLAAEGCRYCLDCLESKPELADDALLD